MRRILFGLALTWIFAISVATMGALTFAASPPSSDSEEVYTVLKEGKDLIQKKKENDKNLSVMEKDVPQKEVDDANLKAAEATWYKYASDFNQRCARNFVRGEEVAMAACQAEANNGRPHDEELKKNRKAIDAWFTKFNSLKQQRIELRSEIALWKSKVKINAMLGTCAVSGTELTDIVYGYEICFDGRTKGSERLTTDPAIGTRASPNGPQ